MLRFAGRALAGHRLRVGLSLVGVAIGVAAVVILTALGEGARRYVSDQFRALGTNLLLVIPGKTETTGALPGMGGGTPEDLTLDDAKALERALRSVRRIAPVSMGNETVSHRERSRDVAVIGSTADFEKVRELSVAEGRFLPEGEMERGSPVAVLGRKVAEELFPGESPLGQVVRIGGWRMRVIGVLAPRGVQLGVDLDEVAIVPVATGMRMFNRSTLFRIVLQVGAHVDLEPTRRRVIEILAERHGEEDVTCITQESVVSSLTAILGALTAALAGIGAISLTVAGIGIMNVMLVTVSERTFEVGLLKALGARRRQIVAVFLVEAVLLSLAGGLVGLAAAYGVVGLFTRIFPEFPAAPPAWAVGLAVAVSIGVGGVFGLLPAAKASRLDPVAALSRR
jgi:putative ABC transport system permease protein